MSLETVINSPIGREFERMARLLKRKPETLLEELLADFIESQADNRLADAMARSARQDLTEDDAVELVRQARRDRQNKK